MALFLIIFIPIFLLILTTCFLLGRNTAANAGSYLRTHPRIPRTVLLGYVIFAGCFVYPIFPIRDADSHLDFMKIYLLVCTYGIIGLGFAGIYRERKKKFIYFATLCLTIVGMICRYFLEYGEVSNLYNFTVFSILSYLALIPPFVVFSYCFFLKTLTDRK